LPEVKPLLREESKEKPLVIPEDRSLATGNRVRDGIRKNFVELL
jgi:hypothetical protein